ncbi:hypothetical protein ACWHA1_06410 [Streptomyces decoyicus]
MKLRKGSRIATVAGATLALMAGISGSGHAAETLGTIETINVAGGSGTFLDGGDRVECYDTRKDGYGIRTYAYSPKGGETWVQYVSCLGGKGDLQQSGDAGFVEGHRVKLKVCYVKRNMDVKCSKYKYATA